MDDVASKGATDPYAEPDCERALATLYFYLDGELTPERRRDIEQHLDRCSPCFGAFGFEAELKLVIARSCRDHVPESLRERVRKALAEASTKTFDDTV